MFITTLTVDWRFSLHAIDPFSLSRPSFGPHYTIDWFFVAESVLWAGLLAAGLVFRFIRRGFHSLGSRCCLGAMHITFFFTLFFMGTYRLFVDGRARAKGNGNDTHLPRVFDWAES